VKGEKMITSRTFSYMPQGAGSNTSARDLARFVTPDHVPPVDDLPHRLEGAERLGGGVREVAHSVRGEGLTATVPGQCSSMISGLITGASAA
jgi:hypothetical protein